MGGKRDLRIGVIGAGDATNWTPPGYTAIVLWGGAEMCSIKFICPESEMHPVALGEWGSRGLQRSDTGADPLKGVRGHGKRCCVPCPHEGAHGTD
jgi:hypothetical protein